MFARSNPAQPGGGKVEFGVAGLDGHGKTCACRVRGDEKQPLLASWVQSLAPSVQDSRHSYSVLAFLPRCAKVPQLASAMRLIPLCLC